MNLSITPRLAARRQLWTDLASFLKSEYSRQLRKHRNWPLPARARPVTVQPARLEQALCARLGTSDFPVILDLLGKGEYDEAMQAAALIRGGADNVRLVLDLGANIGVAAAMFEQRFPNASIIAVEPDRANFALLELNVTSRTVAIRACVAANKRTVALRNSAHRSEPWAITMIESSSSTDERVETVTIGELLHASATIDLLKCDIEGAERELFGDCASWIQRVNVAVVELHAPYQQAEFLSDIQRGCGGRTPFSVMTLRRQGTIEVLLLTHQADGAA